MKYTWFHVKASNMWRGQGWSRREAWFHTLFARGPSSFLNGELDQNGMQRSCSDDSVTLACNLESQCQPSLFKDLDTLRRQEQPPNSFQKCRGLGRCNVCVCICECCGGVFTSVQDRLLHVLSSQACEVILSHHDFGPLARPLFRVA